MVELGKRLEFRVPISPTESFFAQVRFFNFALRRLGPPYDRARLLVVVGDNCDIDQVRKLNSWSDDYNVVWKCVPREIFDEFNMWGTANWRLSAPVEDADIIILSDADTALLRDIDPLLAEMPLATPAMRGHMAHLPPPAEAIGGPAGSSPNFWPWLFEQFGVPWPPAMYHYSMDANKAFPVVPAYFNLGFVAINAKALAVMGQEIIEIERRLKALTGSPMRGQIALTIIAHKAAMDIATLPAEYNAANDLQHLAANGLQAADIRVLHYLRGDEVNRSTIFLPEQIDGFLNRSLTNPANIALQNLARSYRQNLM